MKKDNDKEPRLFDLGGMNAQDGEAWEERWCDTCYRHKWNCAIFRDAVGGGNEDDENYQRNISKLIMKDGEGVCTEYVNKHYHIPKERVSKDQTDIFNLLNEENKMYYCMQCEIEGREPIKQNLSVMGRCLDCIDNDDPLYELPEYKCRSCGKFGSEEEPLKWEEFMNTTEEWMCVECYSKVIVSDELEFLLRDVSERMKTSKETLTEATERAKALLRKYISEE